MLISSPNPGWVRKLTILILAVAITSFPWFGFGISVKAQAGAQVSGVSFARAVLGTRGALIEWQGSDPNNLGFNIYRINKGQRTLLNGQIIPGGVFRGVKHPGPIGNQSYSWLDRDGAADSIYQIESVSLFGELQTSQAVIPSHNANAPQTVADLAGAPTEGIAASKANEETFPAGSRINLPAGPIEDQWVIASKFGLKIYIKSDGWYRVTQQQMVAAGFNPSVDIKNLSLYNDGKELAILTNKDVGQFVSGDYIEFYGRGIDIPTADTRIYYLIAGTTPGKRIAGNIRADGVADPPAPIPIVSVPAQVPEPQRQFAWLLQFYNGRYTGSNQSSAVDNASVPSASSSPSRVEEVRPAVAEVAPAKPVVEGNRTSAEESVVATTADKVNQTEPRIQDVSAQPTPLQSASPKKVGKRSRVRKKARRKAKHHRNHALPSSAAVAVSFDTTVLLKERYLDSTGFRAIYFSSLINGDKENYFGRVLVAPVTSTLNAPNPELTADGPAKLEISIQGVLNQIGSNHTVAVEFNGTQLASYTFGALEALVRTIDIPVNQLVNGANTVKLIKTSTGEACLVDYISLTYPHALKADAGSNLRFSLRPGQSAKIDGFSAANVRLIDYSDPFAVKVTRPTTEVTASGYAITVPTSSVALKGRRSLYAAFENQFNQPGALSLNQPSTLNAASNSADLLIIAHQTLIGSATPLVNLRQSQGMTVKVVDVEDVFDEFSFGTHGPQAIRSFLNQANTSWTNKPKYIIFLGDADLDPRNYEGVGDFDLVPTKLIDATYNETASDDWLADFDNDGIADVPVGRIPARTATEAALEIGKIVNFLPSNVPQSALLVADDPTGYYFNFETANDQVEAQLHQLLPSMTVQRINKRTDPNAHDNIIAKAFGTPSVPLASNEGQALVNYSGHGNVNTWTGANIFNTTDAVAANNGNKLPLVLVMNCLNGYFQDPRLDGIAEGFMKAQLGGAVAVFASSGETIPDGQHEMSNRLYQLLYGPQPIALGDAIKDAKTFTNDIDVRRTWVFFGDPSMKIR